MKVSTLIIISILLFACTSNRILIGTWEMIEYPELNRETQLQIGKKEFTFRINGKETKRIG